MVFKSLAAPNILFICLSSIIPMLRKWVCERAGTLFNAVNPASNRGRAYIGRPIDISQSETDEICPGDTGFLQISVRPPLGIYKNWQKWWIINSTDFTHKHHLVFINKKYCSLIQIELKASTSGNTTDNTISVTIVVIKESNPSEINCSH